MSPIRRDGFDLLQRAAPRERLSAPVTVVLIDEQTLEAYGQWPWSRDLVAKLIDAIAAFEPAAIAVDLIFAEPDRLAPARIAERIEIATPDLAARLRELPDPDAALSRAVGAAPVVLAVGADSTAGPDSLAMAEATITLDGPRPWAMIPDFPGAVRSIALIDFAAAGHGLVAPIDDGDGIVRQIRAIARLDGAPAATLSLEALRVAANSSGFRLETDASGALAISVAGTRAPLDPDGAMWIAYAPRDLASLAPAVAVFDGSIDPQRLKGRVVLLGVSGLGLVDRQLTPLGDEVYGVEIHAQAIEQLYDGATPSRPRVARTLELGATLLIGLGFAATGALGGVGAMGLMGVIAIAGPPLIALAAWRSSGLILDGFTPAIAGAAIAAATLGGALAEAARRRRALRRALRLQHEAAIRVEGELAAARSIQRDMLPRVAPIAGLLDASALLEPARGVSGDYFDFVRRGEDKVLVSIGDVSGKGVGASLFMALAKSLSKSVALRSTGGPGAAMSLANDEIARDNNQAMFATALAVEIDLRTGVLSWACAGHMGPIIVDATGTVRALEGSSGPPLGLMEGFDYPQNTDQLAPGALMLLYTDGASEAEDGEGRLFGSQRLMTAAAHAAAAPDADAALKAMAASVHAFAAGVEQSDDLTMIAVRRPVAAAGT